MQCRDLVQFFYTQEKAIFHFDVTQFDINYVLDVPFLSFCSSYCFPLSYALRGYKCLFFSLFSKPFRLNIFYYIPIYYTVGLYRSSNNLLGSHPKTFLLQLFVFIIITCSSNSLFKISSVQNICVHVQWQSKNSIFKNKT